MCSPLGAQVCLSIAMLPGRCGALTAHPDTLAEPRQTLGNLPAHLSCPSNTGFMTCRAGVWNKKGALPLLVSQQAM